MIRRFLKMPVGDDDIKVHDERQGRVRIGTDALSRKVLFPDKDKY